MTHIRNPELTDPLQVYVSGRLAEIGWIPEARRQLLDQLAHYVADRGARNGNAKLVFICTHNSRRSHLSQIWATMAAEYYGVAGVETFSGGTEATAFDPRAVSAVERAGFLVEQDSPGSNPVYLVRYRDGGPPVKAYSKVFNDRPNPATDFCAVMTCSDADAACPTVPGAAKRIAITYDDPKNFDGTEQETEKYDERCSQIAREMLYAFSRVAEGKNAK